MGKLDKQWDYYISKEEEFLKNSEAISNLKLRLSWGSVGNQNGIGNYTTLGEAVSYDMEFGDNLLAIARAGAGTNNIPKDKCSEQGIVVFNTPGANANAVKELVLTGLFLSSRKVVEGIEWAKTLKGNGDAVGKMVEKGKSQFAGHEISQKRLGVIGLGAIGGPLANAAIKLGMTVYGCDPFISIDAAWHLDSHVNRVKTRDEIYSQCDIITLHVPLVDDTRKMINEEAISKMKDGVIIKKGTYEK